MNNKNLISFDENNPTHVEKLAYFSSIAGHVSYMIWQETDIIDADLGFREYLAEKFDLKNSFVEDSNGSSHVLNDRNGGYSNFTIHFSYINEEGQNLEMVFNYSGYILYDTEAKEIVLNVLPSTIKKIHSK